MSNAAQKSKYPPWAVFVKWPLAWVRFHFQAQGDPVMATYLALIKFTEKGIKEVKETCKRAADLKMHAAKHDIEVREQLWCMGAYDGVMLFTAPDDETASAAMLSLSSREHVATQTLRCFTATEMGKLVGKLA
jgi:uncharacterized protein with GYD domain